MDPKTLAFFEFLRGTPSYWMAVLERPHRMGVLDWTCGWWHGWQAANDDAFDRA